MPSLRTKTKTENLAGWAYWIRHARSLRDDAFRDARIAKDRCQELYTAHKNRLAHHADVAKAADAVYGAERKVKVTESVYYDVKYTYLVIDHLMNAAARVRRLLTTSEDFVSEKAWARGLAQCRQAMYGWWQDAEEGVAKAHELGMGKELGTGFTKAEIKELLGISKQAKLF